MRALIRNPGETVTENDGIVGIDWDTGAPLTNDSWSGGPYVLVGNYDPSVCEVVGPDEFSDLCFHFVCPLSALFIVTRLGRPGSSQRVKDW